MISGYDIILPNPAEPEYAFEQAVRLAKRIWPNAIVENGDTGEPLDLGSGVEGNNVYAGLREIMVYRDQASRQSWDEEGATQRNLNTMVHILAGWDRLTLVVDDRDHPDIRKIVGAVRAMLGQLARTNLVETVV